MQSKTNNNFSPDYGNKTGKKNAENTSRPRKKGGGKRRDLLKAARKKSRFKTRADSKTETRADSKTGGGSKEIGQIERRR